MNNLGYTQETHSPQDSQEVGQVSRDVLYAYFSFLELIFLVLVFARCREERHPGMGNPQDL